MITTSQDIAVKILALRGPLDHDHCTIARVRAISAVSVMMRRGICPSEIGLTDAFSHWKLTGGLRHSLVKSVEIISREKLS
jgi:hypothetical protein